MKYWIFLLGTVFVIGCKSEMGNGASDKESDQTESSPMNRLLNNDAGNIVKKAIEKSGGWESWVNKKTLSYTKVVQFFDSTGTMERESRQLHQYQLKPELKLRISWEADGDKFVIINNGQQAWKLKNGQKLTAQSDLNQAWNSSFGSHYVMSMPFKLTDPGTVLDYEGLDTLESGRVVHSIKTSYEDGAGTSAGFHTWGYYFDRETYEPAANFLDYGDGFSYTKYEAFIKKQGIRLNQERHSYSTNSTRDLKYVRAIYKNENVEFDLDLDDKLFDQLN